MIKQASMQDSSISDVDPSSLCSFDYEAIEAPAKALMHQAARFLYFKNGKGTMVIDGTEYEIKEHTLVAISPWMITDITAVESTLQLIKIVYDYTYIKNLLSHMVGLADNGSDMLGYLNMQPVLQLDSLQAQDVENILDQLKGELGVASTLEHIPKKPLGFLYTSDKIIELMILYYRFIRQSNGSGQTEKSTVPGNDSILSYIYAHSSEKLTLAKVADVFYMSESSLSKHLRELTGTSYSKLLDAIRIEKASDYLIYTDLQLEEIASLLGFVDASHLSKHFTSKVGVTPIRYRRIYSKVETSYSRDSRNIAFSITNDIYKNYNDEDLAAIQTASKYGISVAEMNRALLYYSEKNFETLLNFVRINKAAELLVSTTNPVIDIAVSVGYSNVKTFNLNFYKFEGMNPTEFRDNVTLQHEDGTEVHVRKKRKTKPAAPITDHNQ